MRIELVNFMSHDSSVIELPSRGVVLVTGHNGSGKSAVVEALATAMWGRGLRGSKWSPWREEPGSVRVDDDQFVVQRQWDGKSKKLTFNTKTGDQAQYDTTAKAQLAVDTVAGSFEVWRRTCVFSSSDAAHFTMASDSDRKELLERLLGLGWFDLASQACKRDLRNASQRLDEARRGKEVAEARMQGIQEQVSKVHDRLAELPAHQDVGLLRAKLTKYEGMLRDARRELNVLYQRHQELVKAGARDAERADAASERLDRLRGSDSCYACGRVVDDALKERMEADIHEAEQAASAARKAVATELNHVRLEESELGEEVDGVLEIVTQTRVGINQIDGLKQRREQLEGLVGQSSAEVEKLTAEIKQLSESIASLTVDVAELEAADQVLGVRGVRSQVVGKTLAGIESLANGWLHKLSGDIEIRLRPYTERKSGSVVDAISLSVVGAGGDGGYLGASAGERRRVDVAILLALAELAAGDQAGVWQSPVFLDEIFDSLDGDGRDAVFELVERLAKNRCVVLITHDESIASRRADLRLKVDSGRIT